MSVRPAGIRRLSVGVNIVGIISVTSGGRRASLFHRLALSLGSGLFLSWRVFQFCARHSEFIVIIKLAETMRGHNGPTGRQTRFGHLYADDVTGRESNGFLFLEQATRANGSPFNGPSPFPALID